MLQRLTFLTATPVPDSTTPKNPAEFLEENSGNGTFSSLSDTLQGVLADGYKMLTAVGIGLIGCALVVAFILFGVLKDNSSIKENKQWIIRLIGAVIGIAMVLTIIGIAYGIGGKIKN